MMSKTSRLKVLGVFIVGIQSFVSFAQEVNVSVDRSEVVRGQTVTLTIEVPQQDQSLDLDLTPLNTDFEVLDTRSSSETRSTNGVEQPWTDYVVTMFPLEEGALTIPSLSVFNERTEPVDIVVYGVGSQQLSQSNADLFLRMEVDEESVFVNDPVQLTIQLFYKISGIRNPQFTELEIPDAIIQAADRPNQYDRLVDGERFGVYELDYVINPQRSGPLTIPDIRFRGEAPDEEFTDFVFRNPKTYSVFAFVDGITIEVKED